MIRAGVGYSDATNPRLAAIEATVAALAQAGLSRASGALIFATPAYGAAYPMILRAVGAEANTQEVAGCSGTGVIAGEVETESGHALAVVVFGGDEIRANRFFVPTLRGRADAVADELVQKVRPQLGKSNLLVLFADTYNFDAAGTLDALRTRLPGVAIAGGGASEDGSIGETFVFCGDTV
ncbi:MAG TPA: FIST N-terminal domain-containing protein, partial [Candidatus Acidoferrales bacterium]|nr:FIST N-terminal domain-containing protein [Candidatus Acidoferrales bacterium]